MDRRRVLASSGAFAVALLGEPLRTMARQEATPRVDRAASAQVVASGLTNPRGMIWTRDGSLLVALAGAAGTTAGVPDVPPPAGPFVGGPSAAVVRIEDGCPVAVASGLPSVRDGEGGISGAADLAILHDDLYVLIAGGGEVFGNPGTTNGVYRVEDDGSITLIADTFAWLLANPPDAAGWTAPPEGYPTPGSPYAMVADEDAGLLWVVDALDGLILTVTPAGEIRLAGQLSEGHPVPTAIALAPGGGVDIGTLTAAPFLDGSAKVVHLDPDGRVSDVWTGLTAVTGLAVAADGTRYAVELSTGNTLEPPFLMPGSGRVVRQTGPDRLETVATDLLFPVLGKFGPDGALYVSLPGIGADDGSGDIVRVALPGASSAAGASAAGPESACSPITATPTA